MAEVTDTDRSTTCLNSGPHENVCGYGCILTNLTEEDKKKLISAMYLKRIAKSWGLKNL